MRELHSVKSSFIQDSMEIGQPLTIFFPHKLVFGKGTFSALPADVLETGSSRVMIITISALMPAIQDFIKQLETLGIQVGTDTSITQEPTFNDFQNVMKSATALQPDTIVGIGGGSVLDVAKVVAAQLDNDQSLHDIVGIGLLRGRKKKLICVPATSGTGSEVSPNSILVDDSNEQKKGIISRYLVPDIVYVDPLLTLSVPQSITAATGLDALTHCLEAYTNNFAHPFIDMYALEGMRLISAHLVKAVKNGSDENARTHVAMGSLLGGFCLGPVNTAGVHALAYPLGSSFHLAHGLSNAMLLPHVMKFNLPAAPERYAEVAIALGCSRGKYDIETAQQGIDTVQRLIRECGIPARLRDVGVTQDAIPAMATSAMNVTRLLKNNPRPITHADAVDIYRAAY
jgi:alcohol dehydrogenase class IV